MAITKGREVSIHQSSYAADGPVRVQGMQCRYNVKNRQLREERRGILLSTKIKRRPGRRS